jgi:hypothetical protein
MDGILSDGRKGKLWFCKRHDGHVLGLRVTISTAGGLEERLLLFNSAVAVKADLSAVRIKAKLSGTTHDIECEICGSTRTWWNEKTGLNLLGSLHGKEKVHDASI